jgi:hypothetical protein
VFFNEFNTNFYIYLQKDKPKSIVNYIDYSNIIFLKKEITYTKLKYSRVPQADIVSGGIAAFFSGFLGYLISEKFGFELIDSGDFYFLFIYLVFIISSFKFWVKLFYDKNYFIVLYPLFNIIKIIKVWFFFMKKKL